MRGLRWEGGINEFRAELHNRPAAVTADAIYIVTNAAHDAAAEMRAAYPVGKTGQLRDGVTVLEKSDASRFLASAWVHNVTWYARIFEYGSQTRQTRSGTPNPLPAGKVFIPIVTRYRRLLFTDLLRASLLQHGAKSVRGAA